ncbi:hypothetical protein NPIL_210601 [Nephila pilipes]|uniref:Uncharacterized protein n=1 Tax=Nephila pilipes TaxID=299642 RepID=A0A8X6PS66_NEPPI|nr:hypothetical protein NPIL_210601 [Nephila pilipes]
MPLYKDKMSGPVGENNFTTHLRSYRGTPSKLDNLPKRTELSRKGLELVAHPFSSPPDDYHPNAKKKLLGPVCRLAII